MQFSRWHVVALLAFAFLRARRRRWGQSTAPQPVLHRRSYNRMASWILTLARAVEPYSPWRLQENTRWGLGGTVDVELQPDRLSGFITRLGDRESDEGTPLTFFFSTSRLSGSRLSFTTRQVHGVWFSFEGTIVRGSARSRDQQGYYLLQGQLVLHDVGSQTQQARMVSLPLARQSPNG